MREPCIILHTRGFARGLNAKLITRGQLGFFTFFYRTDYFYISSSEKQIGNIQVIYQKVIYLCKNYSSEIVRMFHTILSVACIQAFPYGIHHSFGASVTITFARARKETPFLIYKFYYHFIFKLITILVVLHYERLTGIIGHQVTFCKGHCGL